MVEVSLADSVNHLKRIEPWHVTTDDAPVTTPTPARTTYSVRMLHKAKPDDWFWHPHVMSRVARFCRDHEEQADATELVRNVQQAFVMDDPGLMTLAFFRDATLIGHVLCDRAILYYKPIVTVHQYLLDHNIPNEIRSEAVALIREWAKDPGPEGQRSPAAFIQWLVRDKRLARLYRRFFKAQPHLLLMRMDVEEE